ncbi:hypothetical protein TNCV_5040991 [Trichonephila clavipes]|nr:hypothetical protein TNCV_5040991 [Trichonephila clavipes]
MTPEPPPLSPDFHTSPTRKPLSSTNLACIGPLNMVDLQRHQARTYDTPATSPLPRSMGYCSHLMLEYLRK